MLNLRSAYFFLLLACNSAGVSITLQDSIDELRKLSNKDPLKNLPAVVPTEAFLQLDDPRVTQNIVEVNCDLIKKEVEAANTQVAEDVDSSWKKYNTLGGEQDG